VLLRLGRDRKLRLVESGEQLLEVIIESLRRLEEELQGETPAAPDLWNRLPDGALRPKSENELSDYVVRISDETCRPGESSPTARWRSGVGRERRKGSGQTFTSMR
jgi:hypothetical protein